MASSKKATASLFNNMSSITSNENIKEVEKEEVILEETNTHIEESSESLEKNVIIENNIKQLETDNGVAKKDEVATGKKTVSFTTPADIKDKLQRYSIAFPDSISQYITDLIKKDFEQNEEKYEEIATLLEKVKGLR